MERVVASSRIVQACQRGVERITEELCRTVQYSATGRLFGRVSVSSERLKRAFEHSLFRTISAGLVTTARGSTIGERITAPPPTTEIVVDLEGSVVYRQITTTLNGSFSDRVEQLSRAGETSRVRRFTISTNANWIGVVSAFAAGASLTQFVLRSQAADLAGLWPLVVVGAIGLSGMIYSASR